MRTPSCLGKRASNWDVTTPSRQSALALNPFNITSACRLAFSRHEPRRPYSPSSLVTRVGHLGGAAAVSANNLPRWAVLPEPNFIDRDPQAIAAEIVALYEQRTGKTLYPAQAERILVDAGLSGRTSRRNAPARTVVQDHPALRSRDTTHLGTADRCRHPLLKTGLPDNTTLELVDETCSAVKVRPLCDEVQVPSSAAHSYSIVAALSWACT